MPLVTVDISLFEIDEIDLVDELQDRGYTVIKGDLRYADELVELYKDYKTYGFSDKFESILKDFFEGL